ncbi:hypothetical protein MMC28_009739 [Mycoblastus sanguinarius]|nr:hypothetical protein [Mycoblastus sanguinarius]
MKTLTKSTLENLKKGFTVSDLPLTFRDAIFVARKFGVRYLWIDSLCIIQDSLEDWQQEASTMGDVYQSSVCNIAATGAFDSHGGCFLDRSVPLDEPCIVESSWDNTPYSLYHIIDDGLWEFNIAKAPLNRRAWVLQERLLAPRVLHFGREQMSWECHELEACETFQRGIPKSMKSSYTNYKNRTICIRGNTLKASSGQRANPNMDQLNIYNSWAAILEVYVASDITRPTDKLIALSGIAKKFQVVLGDAYLAGLWKENLERQLLWYVKKCRRWNGLPSSRSETYRAPSWSWASVDGSVIFRKCFPRPNEIMTSKLMITITDAQVSYLNDDPTAQITDGSIRLRGALFPSLLEHGESGYLTLSFHLSGLKDSKTRPDPNTASRAVVVDADEYPEDIEGSFYCLPIASFLEEDTTYIEGLVLQPVGPAKGTYRRFGRFWCWDAEQVRMFTSSEHERENHHDLYDDTDQCHVTLI